MKITAVRAIPLNVPFEFNSAGIKKPSNLAICHVEIETDEGITGYGLSAITEEHPVASTINDILASDLIGQDPLNTERLWDRMYWNVCPRGQTGYAMHAISALDIALWDIKGKALGLPVWKLLGGAREKVPAYATFRLCIPERRRTGQRRARLRRSRVQGPENGGGPPWSATS